MSAALRYVKFLTTDDTLISYAEDAMVRTPQRTLKRAGDVHDSETVRIRVYNDKTKKWGEQFATRQTVDYKHCLQRIDGEGAVAPVATQPRCQCGYAASDHREIASGKRKAGPCRSYTPVQPLAVHVPVVLASVPVADPAPAGEERESTTPSTPRGRAGKGWARIQVKPGRVTLELAPWIDPKIARRVAGDALGMAEVLCDGEVRKVRDQNALPGGAYSVEDAAWLFVSDTDAAIACMTEYLLQVGYNVQK